MMVKRRFRDSLFVLTELFGFVFALEAVVVPVAHHVLVDALSAVFAFVVSLGVACLVHFRALVDALVRRVRVTTIRDRARVDAAVVDAIAQLGLVRNANHGQMQRVVWGLKLSNFSKLGV